MGDALHDWFRMMCKGMEVTPLTANGQFSMPGVNCGAASIVIFTASK
jgi:hypothetical protein